MLNDSDGDPTQIQAYVSNELKRIVTAQGGKPSVYFFAVGPGNDYHSNLVAVSVSDKHKFTFYYADNHTVQEYSASQLDEHLGTYLGGAWYVYTHLAKDGVTRLDTGTENLHPMLLKTRITQLKRGR